MKIIINASNLRVGGAIQVTISVINELHLFPDTVFHVFLSPVFKGLVSEVTFRLNNVKLYWVDFPSRFTLSGRVTQLDHLEKKISADCVFSVFGPTYWKPKAPHLAGFAQGYYLYSHLPYFKSLNIIAKFKLFILSTYHKLLLKSHVDEFVVETDDVRIRLSQFLNISQSEIHVATNTYSSYFENYVSEALQPRKAPFKLLTVAYPYPHKNLEILKSVSDILNTQGVNYKFYITVPDDHYSEFFSDYKSTIINLGPIRNSDCPEIYKNCDAMILPSLVECFSAAYPEAMKMQRPILTSDYSFAKSVCGDAAMYFNALNPEDIALKIKQLANNDLLYRSLVLAGNERLNYFLSPAQRCSKYIELVTKMRDK